MFLLLAFSSVTLTKLPSYFIITSLSNNGIFDKIKSDKKQRNYQLFEAIIESSSESRKKLLEISREKGSSIWLSTLPIKEEGFQIDKQSFWDLIKIRYGYQLIRLPNECACGSKFNLEHALSCKKGGFVTLTPQFNTRYNCKVSF